jgi:hypothetical protein
VSARQARALVGIPPRSVRGQIEAALDEVGRPWPWSRRVSLLLDQLLAREGAE